MSDTEAIPVTKDPAAKNVLAAGSVISALAALIGASCCILPILLVNLGVGAALLTNLAFFASNKAYFLNASIVFIVIATVAAFWKGRRPSRRTLTILCSAAIFTLIAYFLPSFEGRLLRYLFS
ncbi:MAG: hypothetical protein SFV19_18955 [Rhodospirillaceae bacterium]|nr:hypothetical protein [Rhodospirillaceae bacterium]